MTTPNMFDPFLADVVVVFPGNAWQTNAVNNSVMFQETRNSTITFLNAPNAPVILEGQIGVTFYLPPIVQVNSIHNFFSSTCLKVNLQGETVNK